MDKAEFTLAISRQVRLLTFSKLNFEFSFGISNHIFSMYSSAVLSSCLYPLYNCLRGNSREVFPLLSTTHVFNAKKKMVKSPIGEALIKFPPMVAMFRIGVEEISLTYLLKSGKILWMSVDSWRSVTVAAAPMTILFPSFFMPFNSG